MLAFHEPYGNGVTGKDQLKYVAIKDIHRIDVVPDWAPVYKSGSRAIIHCKGNDGPQYHTTETAQQLVAMMEETGQSG